jgi:hypothetical protein
MLIPKRHRQHLKSIGHRHWFWKRLPDWMLGERYKFRNGVMVYLLDDEIITLRRGAKFLWKSEGVKW